MSITQEQKIIVQTTFAQVTDANHLAAQFYARLFEIDPTTKPLFTHNMEEQGKKLIQTLALVVHGLDDVGNLVPAVQHLGKRHANYGVTVQQWDSVGNALLWTLEKTFGEAFTPEVKNAWAAAYGVIAETAMGAAYAA